MTRLSLADTVLEMCAATIRRVVLVFTVRGHAFVAAEGRRHHNMEEEERWWF